DPSTRYGDGRIPNGKRQARARREKGIFERRGPALPLYGRCDRDHGAGREAFWKAPFGEGGPRLEEGRRGPFFEFRRKSLGGLSERPRTARRYHRSRLMEGRGSCLIFALKSTGPKGGKAWESSASQEV